MMRGISPKFDGRPLTAPADSVEIAVDPPTPPSTNKLWRNDRRRMLQMPVTGGCGEPTSTSSDELGRDRRKLSRSASRPLKNPGS